MQWAAKAGRVPPLLGGSRVRAVGAGLCLHTDSILTHFMITLPMKSGLTVTLTMTTLMTMMATGAVTVLVRRADGAEYGDNDANSDGHGDGDSGDDTRGARRRST